jgi:glucosamine kinase
MQRFATLRFVASLFKTPHGDFIPCSSSHHMIEYLIGVDGGGTGTRAHVARMPHADAIRILGSGRAGPSALRQGVMKAWTEIERAIRAAFAEANIPLPAWSHCALGAGLSGVSQKSLREEFLANSLGFAEIALDTDGFVTLLGAHAGAPGAVVAFGTGSVGEVLRADGSRDVVSGWGFPVGDEGSGAWMGLCAMRIAQAAADGRAPAGALAYNVWSMVGAAEERKRESLQAWCSSAGQFAYAQLAPAVFESAAADPAAEAILNAAVQEMTAVAAALDRNATLPLVIAGSIGLRLIERLPEPLRARIVKAKADAATGALNLIQRALQRKTNVTT